MSSPRAARRGRRTLRASQTEPAKPGEPTPEQRIAKLDGELDDLDVGELECRAETQLVMALGELVDVRTKATGQIEAERGVLRIAAHRRLRDLFLRAARGAPLPEGIEALLFGGGA